MHTHIPERVEGERREVRGCWLVSCKKPTHTHTHTQEKILRVNERAGGWSRRSEVKDG